MVNHKLNEHLMPSASNGGSVLGIRGWIQVFRAIFGVLDIRSISGVFGHSSHFWGSGHLAHCGGFWPFLGFRVSVHFSGFGLLGVLSISGHSVHFLGLGGLAHFWDFRRFRFIDIVIYCNLIVHFQRPWEYFHVFSHAAVASI